MPKILNVEGSHASHLIEKYVFHSLDLANATGKFESDQRFSTTDKESSQRPKDEPNFSESVLVNKNNELIETLLKKVDELSSSLVKMEMQMEKQSVDFEARLNDERKRSHDEGYSAGVKEATENLQQSIDEKLMHLTDSIEKVDSVYGEFETKIDAMEKELIGVAIDIAGEVIQKEVSKESSAIAESLAHDLMHDLKTATKITVKVNPKDFSYIKEKLESEKVHIKADAAINEGGVVLLSDVGNIDGQIHLRFKNLKNSLLNN